MYGNAGHALDEPYTVVITSRIAMKYFNRYNVVGETLNVFERLFRIDHDCGGGGLRAGCTYPK